MAVVRHKVVASNQLWLLAIILLRAFSDAERKRRCAVLDRQRMEDELVCWRKAKERKVRA